MKLTLRLLITTAIATLIGGAAVLGSGPTLPAAQAVRHGQPVRVVNVNDFIFDSFDAEYELGRDDEGRSTLKTVETIVAVFPDIDQNRGFIRDIPREYNDYDTRIDVVSVTDENGDARPYSTENYGDYLSVTMAVPEGSFVHGEQTYVLEYTQRDVTKHFDATKAGTDEIANNTDAVDEGGIDEFYWDVNGTEWMQPFARVSAHLTLSEELSSAFSGAASCYRGSYGSTSECQLTTKGRTLIANEKTSRRTKTSR